MLELLIGGYVERVILGVGDELRQVLVGLGALLGARDDLAAAVLGIALALGPAAVLEGINKPHHIGGVDGQGLRQEGLGGGIRFDEAGKHPEFADGGLLSLQGRLDAIAGAAAQAL